MEAYSFCYISLIPPVNRCTVCVLWYFALNEYLAFEQRLQIFNGMEGKQFSIFKEELWFNRCGWHLKGSHSDYLTVGTTKGWRRTRNSMKIDKMKDLA